MNRRQALKSGGALGLAGAISYTGYKYFFEEGKPLSPSLNSVLPLLAELVECIIPQTDTPGAKEAGVHIFIFNVIQDCSFPRESQRFWKGIKDLETYTKNKYNADFLNCSTIQKEEIMNHFERKGKSFPGFFGKVERKLFGDSFFNLLKNYTVSGYCMSMLGATRNFRYDYIPVKFDACIPYEAGTPSWATK